jgi:ubiquinone/menaquinone biosynthesis C-methylase UbiE
MRVLKPEGKLVIVDFGNPSRWHPFRYLWLPFLGLLEPFAVALWNNELTDIVPAQMLRRTWRKTSYFGGLFQKLASER